jgi:hypothetical protein
MFLTVLSLKLSRGGSHVYVHHGNFRTLLEPGIFKNRMIFKNIFAKKMGEKKMRF